MGNKWKIIAIVFITICLIETAFIIWAVNLGTEYIENDNECAINICREFESYSYDESTSMCYCYNDGEIEYQEYLGKG